MPKKFGKKENQIIVNKLKEIGLKLFSKYGLKKTSIKDLTSEAGIAQGSFYNFFNSKEELYFKILETEEKKIELDMKKAILSSKSAREAVQYTINESSTLFDRTPLLKRIYESNDYDIMVRKLPGEKLEKHQKEDTQLVINTILKVKQEDETIQVSPEIISGILRGITLLNLHREEIGEEVFPDVIKVLADSVADGLVKKNPVNCEILDKKNRRNDIYGKKTKGSNFSKFTGVNNSCCCTHSRNINTGCWNTPRYSVDTEILTLTKHKGHNTWNHIRSLCDGNRTHFTPVKLRPLEGE